MPQKPSEKLISATNGPSDPTEPQLLSSREIDCLKLTADGKRSRAIADELSLAIVTVEMHLRNIRRKLNAKTTPEAVAIALRRRVIG